MFEQPHVRKKYSYYIMDPITQTNECDSVPVEPVVEPVPLEPVVEPVVEAVVEAVELVQESVVEPVVESVIESMPESIVESIVDSIDSVLEQVDDSEVPKQSLVSSILIPTVTTLPKPPVRPVKKVMKFF